MRTIVNTFGKILMSAKAAARKPMKRAQPGKAASSALLPLAARFT
jgi:hypothetical protein